MRVNVPPGVALRPVASLVPAARNARTHSPAQVSALAASLVEYGFNNPVLIDAAGGIIAGHGRVLAAQELGLDEVPVVELPHLTETQRRAYLLADNRLAELAGWDETLLAAELADLRGLEVDLDVLGFDARELDRLLRAEAPPQTAAEDATPELPTEPLARPGDVWTCGRHRLVCGDATRPAVRAAVLQDAAVDIVVTDPPYGVAWESTSPTRRKKWKPIAGDEAGGGPKLRALVRAAIPPARARYVCAAWDSYPDFTAALGTPASVCVWVKPYLGMGRNYRRQYELVLFYGGLERTDLADVWRFERAADYQHPTQKPVALVAKAIADADAVSVFDPFAGSGTALIAAEQLGRVCYAIEYEPRYIDVAVQRWETYTGRRATRADGRSLADIAEEQLARAARHAS